MGSTAPDITKDFIHKLKTNGLSGEKVRSMERAADRGRAPGMDSATDAVRWVWWYTKVRNGAEWDLKNQDYKPYKKSGVTLCGQHYNYDVPGNFHYGFVGAAAGFMKATLLGGAAAAQIRADTSSEKFWCTYGDDPEDHEFIRLGVMLYKQVGLAVNEVNLKETLAKFQQITCAMPPELPEPRLRVP